MKTYINGGLDHDSNNRKIHYIILAIIILFAAFMRLFHLGTWSFWIEENHSVRDILALNSLQQILLGVRPLFFLLAKLPVTMLGVTEWSARIAACVVGILTVPLIFWFGKRTVGVTTALLAAFLLAASPWHIYWSQNARFYTLLLLLSSISLFTFYLALETDKIRYILISVISLGLAGLAQITAALIVPVYFLHFFMLKILPWPKPPGLRWRNLLPFLGVPLAGYLGLEVVLYMFNEPSLIDTFYRLFVNSATASFIGYETPYVMLTAVIYYIGVPLAILATCISLYLFRCKDRLGLLLVLGAWMPLLIMMFLTSVATTTNRYVFMTLPYWVLLAAIGIKVLYVRAGSKIWGMGLFAVTALVLLRDPVIDDFHHYIGNTTHWALFAGLATISILIGLYIHYSLGFTAIQKTPTAWSTALLAILLLHPAVADSLYYTYQHGHRDDWKAVVKIVQPQMQDTDLIISSTPPLADHYFGRNVQHISEIDFDEQPVMVRPRQWVIEDFGVTQDFGEKFVVWAEDNCSMIESLDKYTGGRIWKMRIHLCTAADNVVKISPSVVPQTQSQQNP